MSTRGGTKKELWKAIRDLQTRNAELSEEIAALRFKEPASVAQQAIAGPNDGHKPCPECKVPEFYYRKDGIYCWNCGKQLYKWVGTASAIAERCTQ